MSKVLYGVDEDGPRMKPDDGTGPKLHTSMVQKDSPLAAEMNDEQMKWFLRHVCDQWTRNHGSLDTWRSKMAKWEHMSQMDYSDRIGKPDPNNPESVRDVFSFQNDTLGMSEGFVDFASAQAIDDIFGTKPWLAATPEGRNDNDLAELVTKHSQWKLGQSDLEPALIDGVRIACWGGTAFAKSRWERDIETFKKSVTVASSKASGGFYTSPTGEYIQTVEELETMNAAAEDIEWKPHFVEETVTVYDNVRCSCLDYRDVAFDEKAQQLDLAFTSFYSRFRMGLLDMISYYKIPEELHQDLRNALVGSNEEARTERGESTNPAASTEETEANPQVSLVEGFVRCDPMKTGKPIRIHCIFSPTLNILFAVDYLANITPGGILPIFPLRIGKLPRRIFGVGYFEKYENSNNAVDRQHNATTYRNKLAANVISAIQPDALLDKDPKDYLVDSSKPVVLDNGKSIADFIQFAVIPDAETRSVELLNQHMQMAQMRSGITSAAQGELKGVPNASTATGVNQLTSRGALLLKDPISQVTSDVRKMVEFNVHLLYANHDRDETFTWGEGRDAELLTIKAGDVKGLRMNVTLTLVQSQNQSKLANAQAAISIATGYATLPETEKASQRRLYVQAISSLGFNDAEEIIRQATVDPLGIIALLPPDIAPIVQQALVAAGVMMPEAPEGGGPQEPTSAPVTAAA